MTRTSARSMRPDARRVGRAARRARIASASIEQHLVHAARSVVLPSPASCASRTSRGSWDDVLAERLRAAPVLVERRA